MDEGDWMKGKYETDVKSRFSEIQRWASVGATEKEIYENLGISESAFYKYKATHEEFKEVLKKARKKPVLEIKAALFKRAIGFQYSEKKEIEDSSGFYRVEHMTKTALPDPASAMILLKHWDKENEWTNDPATLELKKRELALKEKIAEDNEW